MAKGELASRLAVALVGIPVVLAALWLGGWYLGALLAAVAAVAAIELCRLAEARGQRPFTALAAAASGALVLLATAEPTPPGLGPAVVAVLVAVTLLSLGGAIWLRWPGGEPLAALSVTVTAVLYTGATLASVPLLRAAGEEGALAGTGLVLLPLLATWAGDTIAYFAGRAWGRAKLAPSVSPGKTVVGAVAGLLGSTGAALVLAATTLGGRPLLDVGLPQAAGIGMLIGAAGQLGDLAESMLKREAGVKDSGTLLAGHGGMLDRIDALLFAFPAAWGLLYLVGAVP